MSDNEEIKFKLDAPEKDRERMTDELAEAPTYRMILKPDLHRPQVLTVLSPEEARPSSGKTEVVSRSLTQKLDRSGQGDNLSSARYEMLRTLGEGGVGKVYEMMDNNTRRHVAVKLLKDGSTAEDVDGFIGEGILASELEHPNIIPVYDLDSDDNGQVYLTMKKVDGRDLLNHVRSRNPIDFDEVALIFHKICDALSYAHSLGKVHQDVKPENVMVGRFGEVFLIDWGSGSLHGDEMQVSPVYMSPEQATGAQPSLSDDIYCLGASLFHVLTGRFPTEGMTIDELWGKKLEGIVDPLPNRIKNQIPQPLLAIAMKAMEPELNDRYGSIQGFANDLKAYLSGFATSAESASAFLLFKLLLKRRWKETSAACLILIGLLIGGVAYYSGIQSARLETERTKLDLQREEVARREAEIKAKEYEASLKDKWVPLIDVDFIETQELDPRFKYEGTPQFDGRGLRMGGIDSLQYLVWGEPIGSDLKVELSFTCRSNPCLRLQVSRDEHRTGYAYQVAKNLSLIGKGDWLVLAPGSPASDDAIRWDAPNIMTFRREGNRFLAEVNGVKAIDHTVVADTSSEEDGLFKIERYFAYDIMHIHSIRVWRRQEPDYVSVLAQGRALMRVGEKEAARKSFLYFGRTSLDKGIRHEAQFLAARLAPTEALRFEEYQQIVAEQGHLYRINGLLECAYVLADTEDWSRGMDMAFEAARLSPQQARLGDIITRFRRNIKGLPEHAKVPLLRRVVENSSEKANFADMGIDDISFLKGTSLRWLSLKGNPVSDITPLRGMSIVDLDLSETNVKDVTVLSTMPLRDLSLSSTPVEDLSPLRGKRLTALYLRKCRNLDAATLEGVRTRLLAIDDVPIADASVLKNTGAVILRTRRCGLDDISCLSKAPPWLAVLSGNQISDLSPLSGSKMDVCLLPYNRIKDLSPLRGCRFGKLSLAGNPLSDISPLKDVEVQNLDLSNTQVKDISPLAGTKITQLNLNNTPVVDFRPLLAMPKLESLSIENATITTQAAEQLSRLRLSKFNCTLDTQMLEVASRLKQLKEIAGLKAKHVLPVAPHILTALRGARLGRRAFRELRMRGEVTPVGRYLLVPLKLSFADSTALCKRLGGTLVCPETEEQSRALAKYMVKLGIRYDRVWIGLERSGTTFTLQSGDDAEWLQSRFNRVQRKDVLGGKPATFRASNKPVGVVETSSPDALRYVILEWKAGRQQRD